MKASYSPQALAQITQAFEYIVGDNPVAANAFLLRVESIVSLLLSRPGIGRPTQKPGVHVVSLQPYSYLLFYKVLPGRDETRIIRVRHMSRSDAADVRGL
jgi:plasmid stabilization system protein ParE